MTQTTQTMQQARPEQAPPDPADEPDLIVEAALFSAGRPLPLEEVQEQTGLTKAQVRQALETLRADYRERRTSLDVVKSGEKWALALRPRFADKTRHIVPPEVPRHVVRTLALVAYHQPILQSDLKDMVGSKVYEHVGHLVDAGMVRKTPDGLTYRLSTTEDFPEYFGIPTEDPERIRRFLAEKVGLVPKQEDGDEEASPAEAPEPDPAPGDVEADDVADDAADDDADEA